MNSTSVPPIFINFKPRPASEPPPYQPPTPQPRSIGFSDRELPSPHAPSSLDRTSIPNSSERYLQKYEELLRLVRLNAAVTGPQPKYGSNPNMESLRKKNIEALNGYLSDPSQEKSADISALVQHKYLQRFSISNPASLKQMQEDLSAIEKEPPLKRTPLGMEGPTYFVQGTDKPSVIKHMDFGEMAGNKLYESLFRTQGLRFLAVPKGTYWDLERSMLFESGAPPKSIESDPFRRIFSDINASYSSSQAAPPCKSVVAELAKIRGEGFPDFLKNHYESLSSDQKHSLFRRLGKIAGLDLLLGHNDRLLNLVDDENNMVSMEDLYANLENIMVAYDPEKGFALYLIDNPLEDENLQHVDVLRDSISEDSFAGTLADYIRIAIKNCLAEVTHTDSSRIFLKDLERYGAQDIAQGIATMDKQIVESIAPSWVEAATPDIAEARNLLEIASPGFTTRVDDRMKAYLETAHNRSEKKDPSFLTPTARPKSREDVLDHLVSQLRRVSQSVEAAKNFFQAENPPVIPMRDDNPLLEQVFVRALQMRKKPEEITEVDLGALREVLALLDNRETPHWSAPTPLDWAALHHNDESMPHSYSFAAAATPLIGNERGNPLDDQHH